MALRSGFETWARFGPVPSQKPHHRSSSLLFVHCHVALVHGTIYGRDISECSEVVCTDIAWPATCMTSQIVSGSTHDGALQFPALGSVFNIVIALPFDCTFGHAVDDGALVDGSDTVTVLTVHRPSLGGRGGGGASLLADKIMYLGRLRFLSNQHLVNTTEMALSPAGMVLGTFVRGPDNTGQVRRAFTASTAHGRVTHLEIHRPAARRKFG